jgi:hypothetical protein
MPETIQVQPVAAETGLEWAERRRKHFADCVAELERLRSRLAELWLWRATDESRREKVLGEMEDYLSAIAAAPDRAHAAHKKLSLSGPNLVFPEEPGVSTIHAYVWRVDDHFRLLNQLALNRLTYELMLKLPPATPISELPLRAQVARALSRNPNRYIYEEIENREEHREVLTTKIGLLEEKLREELDEPKQITARYRLEKLVLDLTGAQALRWDRLSMQMTAAQLLTAAEIATELPAFPTLQQIGGDDFLDEDAWRSKQADNQEALYQYQVAFSSSWRSLSDPEAAEILRRFGQ